MIKMGLGCVQLGLPYGNQADLPLMPEHEAIGILRTAVASGIIFFDTAAAYGDSERRIGASGILDQPGVLVTSKIPIAQESIWHDPNAYWNFCERSIEATLRNLGIKKLQLLQFHQSSVDFLQSPSFKSACETIKKLGFADAIGVSVYHPDEALAASESPLISWLQIPINIIDQRFIRENLLEVYKKNNIRLIARSILMQGVLVADAPLPKVTASELLKNVRSMAQEAAMGQLQDFAFRFIFGNLAKLIEIALIGVQSEHDLRDNLARTLRNITALDPEELRRFEAVQAYVTQHALYNPANWNRIKIDEKPT